MRIFKKILAAVLSIIITLSVCVISSSAASPNAVTNNAPEFSLELISQTSSEAIVRLSLVKGNFLSVDIHFGCSGNIKLCSKFAPTTDFKNLCTKYEENNSPVIKATNPASGMIAIATPTPINSSISLYDITLTKASAKNLNVNDLKPTVENAMSKNSSNADVNTTTSAKISFKVFGFNTDSVTMNFKSKLQLDFSASCPLSDVTFKSSNDKVATIDDNGLVTATGKGTATITATTKDGAESTCKVTVKYTTLQWIIVYILFGWIWYI